MQKNSWVAVISAMIYMNTGKKRGKRFERIAVAVSFSPRIEGVIAESVRLAKVFGAELYFIHIKASEDEDTSDLHTLIKKHVQDISRYEIILRNGNVVNTILKIRKEYNIDLLIAGALEKENYLKYYLGSVSRKLARRAKCSLLLLKDPSANPQHIKKIIVDGRDDPGTLNTIQTALYFAECENCTEIHVVKENELAGLEVLNNEEFKEDEKNNFKEQLAKEESIKMDKMIRQLDCKGLEIKQQLLEGKPGYEIGKFTRDAKADLLVITSSNSLFGILDRFVPDTFTNLIDDLPTNLLIVHPEEE